jgi:4-diphosphocytidyl-2-C-methyl-D-erythritol kinase
VLVALNRQLAQPIDAAALARLAGRLGSDVPFALCGSPMALGWERGRRLLPLEPPPSRPLLLAVPAEGVATAAAFGWLAEDREDGAEIEAEILPGPAALSRWESLERLARNDLEEPVFRRRPELRALRDALSDSGARLSLLCGSGSTVAAVFARDEERDAAAIALEGRIPARLLRARTLG